MNLLARLLPPRRQWDNPLFRSQARLIKWGDSWMRLHNQTLYWALPVALLIFGTWLVFMLFLRYVAYSPNSFPQHWLLLYSQNFWLAATGASLLTVLAVDFRSIAAGVPVISEEIVSGRYELIRLTSISPVDVIVAKYAVARVRAWRTTARLMWARALLAVFGLVLIAWQWFTTGVGSTVFDLLYAGAALVVGTCGAVVFVLEPYWRMKALTALGVAISARALSGVSAPLASGLALLAFWWLELVLIVTLALLFSTASLWMLASQLAVLVCMPVVIAGFGAVIYGFYSGIQHASLRHAAFRLALLER
ncbi:MAG: hypothetical protein J0M07_23280 [Anaerolineae bacterium]|nr:hypothetical protein [Anaerolineae bacterium]